MKNKKRLIEIPTDGVVCIPIMCGDATVGERRIDLRHYPTVDAVEAVVIKEVMQQILETLDILKTTDEELANYTTPNSYYHGKVNAFEITRRLVNAALTDICDNCGAKMDGDVNA